MKKYNIGLFLCLVVIGSIVFGGAVRAQVAGSAVSIQAMIQQLLQQVQQLQTQLRTMQGSTDANQASSVGDVQGSIAAGCAINSSLGYGSRGNSVSLLQNVLHAEGSYPEGLVTGFYGSLTTAAVKQFQQRHGITASGLIDGPTAALVNDIVPQYYSCGSIGFQKLTGLLQVAPVSATMWGGFTLLVSPTGDVTTNNASAAVTYQVRGANDTVTGLLKQYVGQSVTVAGSVKYYSLEGGFWGVVAQSVYPVGSVTSGNGAIIVTSPHAGDVLALGGTYTIQWTMSQKDSLKPQGTVTITTGRPVPACLRSTPACMMAMPSVEPYTIASKVSNTGSYTWTIPATLPAVNKGSQEITIMLDGTDAYGVSGTFSIAAAQNDQTLNVITTSLSSGVVGIPYTATIAAVGGGENYTDGYVWDIVSGSLPAGLTQGRSEMACIKAPCKVPMVISGTPTMAGTYPFVVRVTSGSQTATQALSIVISPSVSTAPVSIQTTSLSNGVVGQSYFADLTATGGSGNYQWSLASGTLPQGIVISNNTTCTSRICPDVMVKPTLSGTPTIAGTYSFTVQVTSGSQAATQALSMVVLSASSTNVVITTASLPSGTVGQTYDATITASGGSDNYAWSVADGLLPDGLTLTSSVCARFPCQGGALLQGIPKKAGTYSFSVRVAVGYSSVVQKFSLTISPSSLIY